MKAFKIGRSRTSDVIIDHASVSRDHAELVATDQGRYYLTDCDSANGTYRKKKGGWSQVRQEYVAPDEPIILGEYETTARQLARGLPTAKRRLFIPADELRFVEDAPAAGAAAVDADGVLAVATPQDDLPRGKVERDPETGEIIRSDD